MKEKKNCPFCWEEILATAIKCKHCWEFLNKEESKKEETKTETPKSKTKWREYVVFWFIIIVLFSFIRSCLNTPMPTSSTRHSSTIQTQTVAEDSSVPKEYRNALKKAQRYAESLYMSKQWIFDQLTSEYWEWFDKDAAQYAIDNLDRDYKANALQKAKKYQDSMNMSKQNLYKQLISEHWEKFTEEEAQFAIDNL